MTVTATTSTTWVLDLTAHGAFDQVWAERVTPSGAVPAIIRVPVRIDVINPSPAWLTALATTIKTLCASATSITVEGTDPARAALVAALNAP